MTPDRPPIVNSVMKPTAKCSALVARIWPPHSVASQLKIFTPVGTAINIVVPENTESAIGPRPTENMWWLHTPHPMNPITTPEYTMTVYPNSGLRENVGSTSDTIPIAGRIRM